MLLDLNSNVVMKVDRLGNGELERRAEAAPTQGYSGPLHMHSEENTSTLHHVRLCRKHTIIHQVIIPQTCQQCIIRPRSSHALQPAGLHLRESSESSCKLVTQPFCKRCWFVQCHHDRGAGAIPVGCSILFSGHYPARPPSFDVEFTF